MSKNDGCCIGCYMISCYERGTCWCLCFGLGIILKDTYSNYMDSFSDLDVYTPCVIYERKKNRYNITYSTTYNICCNCITIKKTENENTCKINTPCYKSKKVYQLTGNGKEVLQTTESNPKNSETKSIESNQIAPETIYGIYN